MLLGLCWGFIVLDKRECSIEESLNYFQGLCAELQEDNEQLSKHYDDMLKALDHIANDLPGAEWRRKMARDAADRAEGRLRCSKCGEVYPDRHDPECFE